MVESKSHKEANARWERTHRQKQRYYNDKSSTKRFIIKETTLNDLKRIKKWCRKRYLYLSKKIK